MCPQEIWNTYSGMWVKSVCVRVCVCVYVCVVQRVRGEFSGNTGRFSPDDCPSNLGAVFFFVGNVEMSILLKSGE